MYVRIKRPWRATAPPHSVPPPPLSSNRVEVGFDYVVAAELAPEPAEGSSVRATREPKEGGGEADSDTTTAESKEEAGGDAESKADASGPVGEEEAAVR